MEPWLERAAALRPDTIAVEAPDGALTYAELLARARAGAAEIDVERVAIALPPGLDFAVALHACLLAGAAALPVDLREPQPRQRGRGTGDRRAAEPNRPAAALTRPGRARRRARRPHVRHHRRAAPGDPDARQRPRQRARLRRRARPRPRRALAVPAAAEPCRRADGAAALGDRGHDGRARLRRPRRRDDRLAGPDAARAPGRPRAPANAARRHARRRARRPGAAGARARRRLARRSRPTG